MSLYNALKDNTLEAIPLSLIFTNVLAIIAPINSLRGSTSAPINKLQGVQIAPYRSSGAGLDLMYFWGVPCLYFLGSWLSLLRYSRIELAALAL